MQRDEQDDTTIYKVVVNHEEQYSIWPADRDNPLGWRDGGKSGAKAECLAHIEAVWTDMRPLSLRKHMEEAARAPRPKPLDDAPPSGDDEDDLVRRLAEGSHPIEAHLRPEKTVQAFRESIERGYVHLKFTDTQGGTELGVKLDREASDLGRADFEAGAGLARLVGGLVLNDAKVRCIAEIDLATLAGQGHLEIVAG